MKQRFLAIALLFVSLCLIVAWFVFSQPSKLIKDVQQQKSKQTSKAQQAQKITPAKKIAQQSLSDQMKKTISTLNDQQIVFYGRAIDQYGEPVADAEVHASVIVYTPTKGGVEKYQTKTNLEGKFQFSGFSGESMGVAVLKSGYEQRPNSGGGIFSLMYPEEKRYKPDPKNPQIIPMWKLKGPEPMVKGGWAPIIPYNETPHFFDLVKGKAVDLGGDLKITMERPPLAPNASRSKGFDWKAKVEILNGGLLEQNDPFPYLAPQNGYQPSFDVDMLAGTTNWTESVNKTFYVKLQGGKMYGRMRVQLNAFFNPPTQCQFEYWLNPSGSRNLEYDPNKRITPERIQQIGLEKAIEEAKDPEKRQREYDASWGIQPGK